MLLKFKKMEEAVMLETIILSIKKVCPCLFKVLSFLLQLINLFRNQIRKYRNIWSIESNKHPEHQQRKQALKDPKLIKVISKNKNQSNRKFLFSMAIFRISCFPSKLVISLRHAHFEIFSRFASTKLRLT